MPNISETTYNCPEPGHRIFLFVYIIIVSFMNLLLLHFIYYKTVDRMKDYRMIIYVTTIIDFTSAWMQFLMGIRITLQNDIQTYNFDGILPPLLGGLEIFAGGRLHFLALFETWTAVFSFAFGPIPFIYRYFVVCWNYELSILQFSLLTGFVGTFSFFSNICYAIMSNEFYAQNSASIPMDPTCVRSLTSWTAAQAVTDLYGPVTFWMFKGRFYGLCAILYSYLIIFYCGWKIQKKIGINTVLFASKKAKSIQRQLSIIIWMQALCPMIVTGSSLIFFYYGIVSNNYKAQAFSNLFQSFKVFPILNPIISLVFVSSYRRSLVDFFRWLGGFNMIHGGWKISQVPHGSTNTT